MLVEFCLVLFRWGTSLHTVSSITSSSSLCSDCVDRWKPSPSIVPGIGSNEQLKHNCIRSFLESFCRYSDQCVFVFRAYVEFHRTSKDSGVLPEVTLALLMANKSFKMELSVHPSEQIESCAGRRSLSHLRFSRYSSVVYQLNMLLINLWEFLE